MPEQVLRIEPEHELRFTGPFNVPTTTVLKLTNPSDKKVCFKIKTTAPKRYCVRPNAGTLHPNQQANIAVIFQPCELEPTANKHKFMVQALFAPDGEVDTDALWKDVDNTKLMDTKLRCTFELPSATTQNDLNAAAEEKQSRKEDATMAKSPKGDADTSNEFADINWNDIQGNSVQDDNQGTTDSSNRVSNQNEALSLRKENTKLKDEIERLQRQLKSLEVNRSTGMSMQAASPPAVPMVYIVLALAAVLIGLIMGKFIL